MQARGSTRSDPHCRSVRHESQCGESLIRLSSHCRSVRNESQCGEKLPFATKSSSVVGGSAILSPGHYRAFRISNTEVKNPHCRSMRHESQCGERLIRLSFQGQGYLEHSSWESRSSPGNKRKTTFYEVVFLCLVIL